MSRSDSVKKLYKSRTDVKLDGVCGGIGEYLGVNTNLVRFVYFVLIISSGVVPGILVYLLAAIILPRS